MTPPKTNKQTKNNQQQQKQNKKQQLPFIPFSVKCIEPHHPSHWKCALQKLFIVVVVVVIIHIIIIHIIIMNVKRLLCNTVVVLLHCLVKTE